MQQGLAFYPILLLLKVFGALNGSVLHVQIIHYAPQVHIQAYNTIN
jgi:hypothetical protein